MASNSYRTARDHPYSRDPQELATRKMNGQLRQVQREEMDEDAQAIRAASRAQMFILRIERYQNLSKDARALLEKIRYEKIRSGYRLYRPPMDTDEINQLTASIEELIVTQFIRLDRDTWDIELVEEDIEEEDEEDEDDQDQGCLDLAERTRGQEIEDEEDDEDSRDAGSIDLAASVERTRGRRQESISSSNSADFSYIEPGTPTQSPGFVTIDGHEDDEDGDENDNDANAGRVIEEQPDNAIAPIHVVNHVDQVQRRAPPPIANIAPLHPIPQPPPNVPQAAAFVNNNGKRFKCRMRVGCVKEVEGFHSDQDRRRHEACCHGWACRLKREDFLYIFKDAKTKKDYENNDGIFVLEETRGKKKDGPRVVYPTGQDVDEYPDPLDFVDRDNNCVWRLFGLSERTGQVAQAIERLNQQLAADEHVKRGQIEFVKTTKYRENYKRYTKKGRFSTRAAMWELVIPKAQMQ